MLMPLNLHRKCKLIMVELHILCTIKRNRKKRRIILHCLAEKKKIRPNNLLGRQNRLFRE